MSRCTMCFWWLHSFVLFDLLLLCTNIWEQNQDRYKNSAKKDWYFQWIIKHIRGRWWLRLWRILIQRMILNTKTKCRDTLTTIFLRFCAIHWESDIYWLKNDERSKLFQNMPFELFGDSWLKTHKLVWLRVFKVLS